MDDDRLDDNGPDPGEQLREAVRFLNQVLDFGIKGIGPLSSAEKLAEPYIKSKSHKTRLERINALVLAEETKNFTSGFLTSFGGILTLPVTIPAAIGANWILQSRMVAAMALIGGFDITEPGVRLSIALCLLGKKGKEIVNSHPNELNQMLRSKAFSQFPSRTIQVLNQAIAIRLMKIAAQKGFTRISKAIPVLGGIVGGVLDLYSCRDTAIFAKELFQFDQPLPEEPQNPPEEPPA